MEIIENTEMWVHLALGLFVAIVFLQSGIDKIVDRRGNLEWLKGHFSKTFLSSMVPIMLTVVTLFEMAAGLIALCGIYCLLFCDDEDYCIKYSLILSLFTLLMLLFGQRIAKDYEGAKTIVIYIGVCLLGLMFF